jgi:hypothetical protein
MKAKSIKGKSAEEIKVAIDKMVSGGFQPTLAIVFISAKKELDPLLKGFLESGIQVFGASSSGEFIDADVETDSIAALLLSVNPSYFHIESVVGEADHTKQIASSIAKTGLAKFKKPVFLIASGGLSTDGDDIVDGIEDICGKNTPIFGGLASDGLEMKRTYAFTNSVVIDHGLVSLIFDAEKVSLTGMAVGGWKPMGMERTITSSQGNVVYTIDHEPALNFMARYAGLKESNERFATSLLTNNNFQLQLLRDYKHPVMRTPMVLNHEDRSVTFAGSLPQDSKVRLSLLPGFEVVEESVKEYMQFKTITSEPDAMIMFSCEGRRICLGPYVGEEIEGIQKIWGVPMAGFFCYGEIGRVSDGQYLFQNMTCSLALLKEITV